MTSINRLLNCVLLALVLLPLQGCSREYSAESIEAWVVDAETSQPLEGVIVVAHWQLYGGMHPDQVGELMILETLTDKAGRFHFPAWGPKSVPAGVASNARLRHLDPEMLLFKSGYKHLRIANELTSAVLNDAGPSLRRSQWNGKTIKMERFKGAIEGKDILRDFENLNSSVETLVRDAEACNWKKIPKMILGIRKQRTFLIEKGITGAPFGISSVDQYLLDNSEKIAREGGAACGSPKNLFESEKP